MDFLRNRRILFGILTIILASVILVAIFTNRTSQLTDFISEEFLKSEPSLHIEEVNREEFTTLDISRPLQQEILTLLMELPLRKTDTTYQLSDADYRITSISNRDFDLHLYLDENIITFQDKSKGYLVTDDTFMERLEALLK